MNIDFLRDDSRCCVVLYVLGVDAADYNRYQSQIEREEDGEGEETFDRHRRESFSGEEDGYSEDREDQCEFVRGRRRERRA